MKIKATPQELWEPAKEGETLENVYIPNRRERRRMLKGKGQKGSKQVRRALRNAENIAKSNPALRQEIYKTLYENLLKKEEELIQKWEKENEDGIPANQGNEDVASGQ